MSRCITLFLVLFLAACVSPFVGYAQFDGIGDVRTDGNALVAFGDIQGEAGVFAKGSNLPMVLPFAVDDGMVYLYNSELEIDRSQSLDDPLPQWVSDMIPDAHLDSIEALIGRELLWAD